MTQEGSTIPPSGSCGRERTSRFDLLRWARATLLLAAVYWAVGKLSLLTAIPPGYATAVWPAAGLALVGVLLYGKRVAPGIVVGSFLVNIATSFDASNLPAIAKSLSVALGLGVGASVQAIVGAALIRRSVGFPTPLDDDRAIGKFVVLGGPVACAISATVGVSTLCAAGIVPGSNYAFSWWTWWVGDSIGVLIFAPLALTFVGKPRGAWRRRRLLVGGTLSAGFTIATVLFIRASAWEESRIQSDIERRAVAIARPLESKLEVYQNLMTSIASLLDASPHIGRESFRIFVQRALGTYPGIQAFSWNPRVTAADRARYEAAARRDGFLNFQFTEKDASGTFVAAASRPEYVVVYYIEPHEGNKRALGYNIASEPARIAALHLARDSGGPSVTARITLVQERRSQYGVLLLVPIFEPALKQADSKPRTLRGYAVGVFRIGDVVETALEGVDRSGLELMLIDESAPSGEQLLYGSQLGGHNDAEATASTPRFQWSRRLEFGGRNWRLVVVATNAYMTSQRSWQAWMVLAAGLLFTGMLGVVLLMTTGRTARVEEQVAARTRELVTANETLAASERALRASDQRSQALLAELEGLNQKLEDRVAERTSELSMANEHLAATSAELASNLEKLRTAQEQLIQAGKLAAVGQLVAGIAHEINNPLAVILGFAEGLNRRVEEGSLLRLPVASIVRESLRCKSLVEELLMFSRTSKRTRDRIDLGSLLRGAGQLLETRARTQETRLSLDLASDVPELSASGTELQQVIVNLGNNALDAMGKGGELVIRSRYSGNGEVHVEVQDTGPGISENIRARIFEPFFTTKEIGKGTGLGLSLAYEIVQRHGGAIDVESVVGKGTTMRIRLPIEEKPSREERSA